ncbi:MAG: hypothetical protein M0Q38_09480 [Bacteroidales bacterium]|jgi:hypothetical protein|nr:hypothetical protein [Bacteroidales bacterium]
MRSVIFLGISLLMVVNIAFCQNNKEYTRLIDEAYKLYQNREYLKSGKKYAEAFVANGNKGLLDDRYNAACSWALANETDSAFALLFMIAKKGNYADYDQLINDNDLKPLYHDSRWEEIKIIIKSNKEKKEANYNKKLIAILDTIFTDDQKYRLQINNVAEKYGWESKEVDSIENDKAFKEKLRKTDSINTVKITSIIDNYGWLRAEVVGDLGNSTFFAVIQHSDLKTQEKYLPIMKEAVKNGNARADHLALLEDRVALKEGCRQIYGSQLGMDPITKKTYVCPLEDPVNVDARRAKVGLPPMQEYLEPAGIKWDIEQYKKELPAIEALERRKLNK